MEVVTSDCARLRSGGALKSSKRRRGDQNSVASASLAAGQAIAFPWQPDHTLTRRTAQIVRYCLLFVFVYFLFLLLFLFDPFLHDYYYYFVELI